jgi:hypothetical protein
VAVALVEDKLGREILGSAAQRPRGARHFLGKPKVGQLRVAPRIDEHVLGLEIAVRDAPVVQVFKREREARLVGARVKVRVGARVGARVRVRVRVRVRMRGEGEGEGEG